MVTMRQHAGREGGFMKPFLLTLLLITSSCTPSTSPSWSNLPYLASASKEPCSSELSLIGIATSCDEQPLDD
jgi:hypothetical protein